MKVRHILVEDPKFGDKTKYYYDQVAALGYDYETIADYDKAAFYYEKLWGAVPRVTKKKEKAKDRRRGRRCHLRQGGRRHLLGRRVPERSG